MNILIYILKKLMRLQELEEVNAEQDNTISAMNDKIKKLNTEIETWKFRYDALIDKFNKEKATYVLSITFPCFH